jgi:hypothetical protein
MNRSRTVSDSSNTYVNVRRWREMTFILCIAVVITAMCSHFLVRYLKMKVSSGVQQNYGAAGKMASTRLYGSSVAYSGIDWERVSEALGGPIESWATAGSTPSEWEHVSSIAAKITHTFIVVSPVELDEHSLSDFRADYVPFMQTIRDLWGMKADWPFSKKVLSQYPLKALRTLFPSAGRSDGVMTGIRDKLKKLINRESPEGETDEVFIFAVQGDSGPVKRLSEWSPDRFERRMILMRARFQGRHSFNGLKKMALIRLFEKASHQGEITCVVMPLSPSYQKEFLTAPLREEFEMELADLHRLWPEMRMIRLDHLPLLDSDAMYTDFVHLNRDGQKIATAAFLRQLQNSTRQP